MTQDEFIYRFRKTAGWKDVLKLKSAPKKAPKPEISAHRRAMMEMDPEFHRVVAKQGYKTKAGSAVKEVAKKWGLPAGIAATGIGATATGTAVGHTKGKKKGRREGAQVGLNIGYRAGARRGYAAGQRHMLERIRKHQASSAKKGGKEKTASAVIPVWLLTYLMP